MLRMTVALVAGFLAIVSAQAQQAAAPSRLDDIVKRGTLRVGMTGDYQSVIGMDKDEPLGRFLRRISSSKFETANGPGTLSALAIETDDATGLAVKVGPVRLGAILEEARPAFWLPVRK